MEHADYVSMNRTNINAPLYTAKLTCGEHGYSQRNRLIYSPVMGSRFFPACLAVVGQTAADDAWCIQNCGNIPPNCPSELCTCDGGASSPAPAEAATPAVPAVPDVPEVPSPAPLGTTEEPNPQLNSAVAEREEKQRKHKQLQLLLLHRF